MTKHRSTSSTTRRLTPSAAVEQAVEDILAGRDVEYTAPTKEGAEYFAAEVARRVRLAHQQVAGLAGHPIQ